VKKCDLKHHMLVETSGGRLGIVVLKDSTDDNCIKFLYDPKYLHDHGCMLNANANMIEPLDNFDDDLNCYYIAAENDGMCGCVYNKDGSLVSSGDKVILWQIIRVYSADKIWERNNLQPTCGGLMGDC
jgi:hypothetical protein